MQRDLMLAGQPVGTVSWRQEGNRLVFAARCPMEAGFIYRVQLLGAGQTVSLGVMEPLGDSFVLKRVMPLSRCRFLASDTGQAEARIVRTRPGEAPGETAGGLLDRYRPVAPGFSTGDRGLDEAIKGKAHVLYLIENNMIQLAFPLKLGAETPFAPYLAATRWQQTEAGDYGLLAIPQPTSL